jgi:hypothetical protein
MSKRIFGFFFTHENRVLAHATDWWCLHFRQHGYAADALDLGDPAHIALLEKALEKGDVLFCFGLQGVGSRLTLNNGASLWTHHRVPFVGMHYDSPCCNIYNHMCDSPYVGNGYFFECFLDMQRRFVKNDQINEKLPIEIDYTHPVIAFPPFAARSRRISLIKSGHSPTLFAEKIDSIKQPLRDAVWSAIESAKRNENLCLGDLLTDAFLACGHDPASHWNEFWGIADWMDKYIRCARAAALVDWLKFQPGAQIIGDGWDFIDKEGAKASFTPSIPAEQTYPIYIDTQFTFNASPYGKDIIHERVFIGLSTYGCVVSDTNAWWDEHFSDVPSLYRFHWGANFPARLDEAINDPHAAENAQSGIGARRIHDTLYKQTAPDAIRSIAEKVRTFADQKMAGTARRNHS